MKKLLLLLFIFPLQLFAQTTDSSAGNSLPFTFEISGGKGFFNQKYTHQVTTFRAGYQKYVLTARFIRTDISIYENAWMIGYRAILPSGFRFTGSLGYSDIAFQRTDYLNGFGYRKAGGLAVDGEAQYFLKNKYDERSAIGLFFGYHAAFNSYKFVGGLMAGVTFEVTSLNRHSRERWAANQKEELRLNDSTGIFLDTNRVCFDWEYGAGRSGHETVFINRLRFTYQRTSIAATFYKNSYFTLDARAFRSAQLTLGHEIYRNKDFSGWLSAGYAATQVPLAAMYYYPNGQVYYYAVQKRRDGFLVNAQTRLSWHLPGKAHDIGLGLALDYTLLWPSLKSLPKHLVTGSLMLQLGDGVRKVRNRQPKTETPFHIDLNIGIGMANHRNIASLYAFAEYRNVVLGVRWGITESGWKAPWYYYNYYGEIAAMTGYRFHIDREWVTLTAGYSAIRMGNADIRDAQHQLVYPPHVYNGLTVMGELAWVSRVAHLGWGVATFATFNAFTPVYGVAIHAKFGKLH